MQVPKGTLRSYLTAAKSSKHPLVDSNQKGLEMSGVRCHIRHGPWINPPGDDIGMASNFKDLIVCLQNFSVYRSPRRATIEMGVGKCYNVRSLTRACRTIFQNVCFPPCRVPLAEPPGVNWQSSSREASSHSTLNNSRAGFMDKGY